MWTWASHGVESELGRGQRASAAAPSTPPTMAVRLRHPKGVSTLQLDFENASVLDLQQQIFTASDIPPSAQECLSPPAVASPDH